MFERKKKDRLALVFPKFDQVFRFGRFAVAIAAVLFGLATAALNQPITP
jgi:hypothetical protein